MRLATVILCVFLVRSGGDHVGLDFDLSSPYAQVLNRVLHVEYGLLGPSFNTMCRHWLGRVKVEVYDPDDGSYQAQTHSQSLCAVCTPTDFEDEFECRNSIFLETVGNARAVLQFLHAREFLASADRDESLLVPVWSSPVLLGGGPSCNDSASGASQSEDERNGATTQSWISRYATLHARIIKGEVPEAERRYVVWRCRPKGSCGGWGNRVTNMIGAFALAVLTDRAFILDYPGSGIEALDQFYGSDIIDWRVPPDFHHTPESEGSFQVGYQDGTSVRSEHALSNWMRTFLFEDWAAYEDKVIWVTERMMLPLGVLLDNSYLRPIACRLGLGVIDQAYSILSNLLLQPRGQLRQRLSSHLAKAKGKPIIALQFRVGLPSDNLFFFTQHYHADLTRFFKVAQHMEATLNLDPDQTVWALVSDNQQVIDLAFSSTFGHKILWFPGEATHMDKTFSRDGHERSLMEWGIMSEVVGAVLTIESSFGISSFLRSVLFRPLTPPPLHSLLGTGRGALVTQRKGDLEAHYCGAEGDCFTAEYKTQYGMSTNPNHKAATDVRWRCGDSGGEAASETMAAVAAVVRDSRQGRAEPAMGGGEGNGVQTLVLLAPRIWEEVSGRVQGGIVIEFASFGVRAEELARSRVSVQVNDKWLGEWSLASDQVRMAAGTADDVREWTAVRRRDCADCQWKEGPALRHRLALHLDATHSDGALVGGLAVVRVYGAEIRSHLEVLLF